MLRIIIICLLCKQPCLNTFYNIEFWQESSSTFLKASCSCNHPLKRVGSCIQLHNITKCLFGALLIKTLREFPDKGHQ